MSSAARTPAAWLAPLLPRREDYRGLRTGWRRDVVSGVTVGIVALPLALGFSVATGVGPVVGLVTAIVAGAVAAVFGGSQLQVSGPTGAMTVVLVPLVAAHGPAVVYPVALLAGIVVVAAALLRLGRLLNYVPWPLIEGFTLGIAVVIAAQQVPHALGVSKPEGANAAKVAALAVGRFAEHPHWGVIMLLALTIALTALLPKLHRAIPASLVAVIVVAAVAAFTHIRAARIGPLPGSLPVPRLPQLSQVGSLGGAVLAVAFLAGLESLMSARAADGMSDAPRHDPDRELFGQGLANIASGICGGMPATGALARTAVNARSGAATRLAALTHSLLLAAVVFSAAGLVSKVPLVALAGVLLVTSYRMVERHNVLAVLRSTRSDAAVFVLTAVGTVWFDLVKAVAAGLLLAGILALSRLSRTAAVVAEPLRDDGVTAEIEHALLADHVLIYRFDGPLFFGASSRFLAELTSARDVQVVILRLRTMAMLDATGARAVREIIDTLEARGITVLLKGASPEHARLLEAVGGTSAGLPLHHVFDNLPDAVAHARLHVIRHLAGGASAHGE